MKSNAQAAPLVDVPLFIRQVCTWHAQKRLREREIPATLAALVFVYGRNDKAAKCGAIVRTVGKKDRKWLSQNGINMKTVRSVVAIRLVVDPAANRVITAYRA